MNFGGLVIGIIGSITVLWGVWKVRPVPIFIGTALVLIGLVMVGDG